MASPKSAQVRHAECSSRCNFNEGAFYEAAVIPLCSGSHTRQAPRLHPPLHNTGQPGRLHHAMNVWLPNTNCGIATCPTRATDTIGLSPTRLWPCRPLLHPFWRITMLPGRLPLKWFPAALSDFMVTRFAGSVSLPWFISENVIPGFSFPAVGRLGLTSPPYRTGKTSPVHRYYCQLRLPKTHLGFVPSSVSSPDTLFAPLLSLAGQVKASLLNARTMPHRLTGALDRIHLQGDSWLSPVPELPL
jgi:hypothetical protein